MVTAQLQEMGSHGSQAFCAKAMKMAFYDKVQLDKKKPSSVCSVLKVKRAATWLISSITVWFFEAFQR